MICLINRTAEEGVFKHQSDISRIYDVVTDVQYERVMRTRALISAALRGTEKGRIVELCCGTGSVSGPFSVLHKLVGYDCVEQSAKLAKARFPCGEFLVADVTKLEPSDCDVVLMCETLEHMTDPVALVKAWLPKARFSVISHPIGGDILLDLSAGTHCWSFDESDLLKWAEYGGHQVRERQEFQMGGYLDAVILTERTGP